MILFYSLSGFSSSTGSKRRGPDVEYTPIKRQLIATNFDKWIVCQNKIQ